MNDTSLFLLVPALLLGCAGAVAPHEAPSSARAGGVIEVPAAGEAFHHPYFLLPPMDAQRRSPPFLLVETNNGGVTEDHEAQRDAALRTATESSVGHAVARLLNVPLLVPVFPRPASAPLTYTHALDRDTLLIGKGPLRRLDLQLIAMIEDARAKLAAMGMDVDARVLVNGFSASGTFGNRFALLHPTRVRAVACGGINGILTLPLPSSGGVGLPYPIGIADLAELSGAAFELEAWREVRQLVYMGANDDNDAVSFDDGYSDDDRRAVYTVLGERMQPDRWEAVQAIYRASGANVVFRTYPDVGHQTTGAMHRDVEEFFGGVIEASVNEDELRPVR